ncbi:MAG TPA: PhnD/SsuA/transferrin family substrate-binding protein [Candidatus Competibacteraceae bacterium]|nr:PhnD/SsuA/transferrin family substrate-binding protein [Candidatus Competibacteraceae bacterium]
MPSPAPSRCVPRLAAALLALLLAAPIRAAELIFGVPPLEITLDGQDIYRPLADYLGEVLRRPVRYEVSPDWLSYQRDLREGRYDLVFDGPHLVGWRLAHSDHEPLVRLPSPLRYHIVVRADDSRLRQLDDLVGHKVCALAPPELSALMLYDGFLNPARQPLQETFGGGFGAVFDGLRAGRCVAAVLLDNFYEHDLSAQDRAGLRILHTTPELPNQALSAGPRVSADERRRIRMALTESSAGNQASARLRAKFDRPARSLQATAAGEYIGYHVLLEGAVFGW